MSTAKCPRCGSEELYVWSRQGVVTIACASCLTRWEIPIHKLARLAEEEECGG